MQVYAPLNSECIPVLQEIEVSTLFQLPSFQIIGLPCPEVAEARERIRSAIEASGFEFPRRKVILNLSPASIRKRGTGLDLAMALAVLSIGKRLGLRCGAWGELGLDGTVKPSGQLTRTMYSIWKLEVPFLFLSRSEFEGAQLALECIRASGEELREPPQLIPVDTLSQAWEMVTRIEKFQSKGVKVDFLENTKGIEIKKEVVLEKKQGSSSLLPIPPVLERMLGVSVSGRHHILLMGPRGAGKSHALDWLAALHPPVSSQNRLQQNLLRELGDFSIHWRRSLEMNAYPLRRVGSHVRPSALLGGATPSVIRPGEFSLAHGGILLADELPEWSRDSRESLREPLERGKVTLTRSQGSVEMPAEFLFAANGNFCPCGGLPPGFPISEDLLHLKRKSLRCQCSSSTRRAYLGRLSGPLLDRIDLVATVVQSHQGNPHPRSAIEKMESLQEKVESVRNRLVQLWGKLPGLLAGGEIEEIIKRKPAFVSTVTEISLDSLRSRHKVSRLALTLAAWDGIDEPKQAHFIEASCYRPERISYLESST